MPTEFKKIFERAVFKFTDYTFLNVTTRIKEEVLQQYLLSAIPDFQHNCVNYDLTKYSLTDMTFEEELSDEVIEILALGISYYWFRAHTLDTKLLRNIIHKSDMTSYSPANLLSVMRHIMDTIYEEYMGKIKTYSYRYGDYSDLKT